MSISRFAKLVIHQDGDLPALVLEVEFNATPGCPETPRTWNDAGSPAEGPEVEILTACCIEIDEEGVAIDPASRVATIIGELCLKAYGDQIEEKVFEHLAQSDWEDDEPEYINNGD